MIFRKFVSAFALAMLPLSAHAQTVSEIATEGRVTAIVQTAKGTYAETERGTLRVSLGNCEGGVCIKPDVIRGLAKAAPQGALPDGTIATAASGDIRKAWFGRPTERYAHGILGDAIEGGSLVVETADGKTEEFVLPEEQVFEDLTPRIADLDGDGANEVITTRSSKTGGSAVVVYGVESGTLVEKAASSENGRPNRWLAIAAIHDGKVHFVRTPHIGGRLAVLDFARAGTAGFETNDIASGVSNHIIGSRVITSAIITDAISGARLALPSQDHASLTLIGAGGTTAIALPGAIDKAVVALDGILIAATEDGRLLAIKP